MRADHARLGATVLGAVTLLLSGPCRVAASDQAQEPVSAASQTVGDPQIARLIRFRIEMQHRGAGVVVGILRPSGPSIVAWGQTALNGRRQMDGSTVFEAASLTKVFTALLLADAATRGEASLDDPLSAYAPPGMSTPGFGTRAITLTDLATHTAGLPLRPNNIHVAPDTPNKYAGYTLAQLYAGLPDYKLTRPPGSRFEYSNVGFALLGHGLGLRLSAPYDDLLRKRVIVPLGLSDTDLEVAASARPREAQGYDVDLKPVSPSHEGALSPAGGLHTTADDLLRFLALFLKGEGPGELPKAARLMLTVDRPGEDKDTRMALGWRRTTTHGETYYWSNGSGDGSRTFMGFNPRRGTAVVALINASSGEGVDDIGRLVLDPAQAVDLKIPAVHHQINLAAGALDHFLGTYQYAPDDRIEITRGVTGLLAGSGPGQFVIYPDGASHFFAKVVDLEFDFGPLTSAAPPFLILHQDGKVYTYKRVR